MPTSFSNPCLVRFSDPQAPYRGAWVFYSASHLGAYAACHELLDQGQPMRVIEQRDLQNLMDARRFSQHLILHGWSPQIINSEQGYRLIGA
jgi:hypothetical protein